MRRPWSLLPALVLAATAVGPAGAASAATPVGGSGGAPTTVPIRADPAEPLQVTITSLSPSAIPARGRLRVRGTVTNLSDERWRAINVHAFVDDTPITSSAELEEARAVPAEADVGSRITTPGTFDAVGSLRPGQTVSFSLALQRSDLPVSQPGVYWFGVHALGNTDAARDGVADGRARTFLPLVPRADARPRVRTALVLPLRRPVRHAPDGRIRSVSRWADDLAPGGRLRSLVDFGAAAGRHPVTWLVDPAVPDAVARLVAGNPPRSLADTVPAEEQPEDDEASDPATPSGDPESEPPEDEAAEPGDGPPDPAADFGSAWLERLRGALAGDHVLTLPYGDPDLAAVAAADPGFYDLALRRAGTQLARWRLTTSPAVGGPERFLPADTLPLLGGRETVLLSERAVAATPPQASVRVDGTRVLLAAADPALGGPGPEPALTEIALRQRILAEAAVRLLFHDRTPLVMALPTAWRSAQPATFWSGLDVPWLRLTDTDGLRGGAKLPADRLQVPVEQELTRLDPENFDAAAQLIAAGDTLDQILPRNDGVAGLVLDQALTSVSYAERERALEARSQTLRAVEWINRRLSQIRIRAPRGVTLSSPSGSFAATVSNRLDHPVRVSIDPISQGEVTVSPPPVLELAAGGRQTVLLDATTSRPGVHYVRLVVTDETGTPLGAAQRVPIRSAQVSDVIWLILGTGVGLLFVAIAVRVVRRIRSERA